MFNDRYGLTAAVLEGRKTQTRRIIKELEGKPPYSFTLSEFGTDDKGKAVISAEFEPNEFVEIYPKYQIGEIVAVAQSYETIAKEDFTEGFTFDYADWVINCRNEKGWKNKMFVRADLMPHHIKITGVKVERLQDISDEDVYKEGFRHEFINNNWGNSAYHEEAILTYYDKKGLTKQIRGREPKEAFSFLIDKVSGIGTWKSNPWVFVYEFKLIK